MLPGGLAADLLVELPGVRLTRPVTDRVELIGLLSARRPHVNAGLFDHARRADLAWAVARVGVALGRPLSTRRCADVALAVRYLCDFPDRHRGSLANLAERSARWHRDRPPPPPATGELPDDAAVDVPPVPLPTVPGLSFLSTAGAIRAEGRRMGHCIGTYVCHAATGRSYLFHFKRGAAAASIEVSAGGVVRRRTARATPTTSPPASAAACSPAGAGRSRPRRPRPRRGSPTGGSPTRRSRSDDIIPLPRSGRPAGALLG